jgi:hypothetical protein
MDLASGNEERHILNTAIYVGIEARRQIQAGLFTSTMNAGTAFSMSGLCQSYSWNALLQRKNRLCHS